jgi:excisionase family DNA binding protein
MKTAQDGTSKSGEAEQGHVDEILTTAEAATYLKIHPRTLTRFAKAAELPGFRIGSHWRFLRSELDLWMRSKVRSPQLNPVRDNWKGESVVTD